MHIFLMAYKVKTGLCAGGLKKILNCQDNQMPTSEPARRLEGQ
jgi:hypothetical protein